jgi:hypothetical protein
MTTASSSTKKKKQQKFIIDSKDCEYCNTWKNYGSDEDNATMEKLKRPEIYRYARE